MSNIGAFLPTSGKIFHTVSTVCGLRKLEIEMNINICLSNPRIPSLPSQPISSKITSTEGLDVWVSLQASKGTDGDFFLCELKKGNNTNSEICCRLTLT